ncbi:MAG TPA: hypothetical protein VH414_20475, partial [Lichenihabitans sp.]|nr:hypothetical protein [Lichenihabitans sp.]
SFAFFGVAAISATAALVFARLPQGAGDALRPTPRASVASAVTTTAGLGDQPAAVLGEGGALGAGRARNPVART